MRCPPIPACWPVGSPASPWTNPAPDPLWRSTSKVSGSDSLSSATTDPPSPTAMDQPERCRHHDDRLPVRPADRGAPGWHWHPTTGGRRSRRRESRRAAPTRLGIKPQALRVVPRLCRSASPGVPMLVRALGRRAPAVFPVLRILWRSGAMLNWATSDDFGEDAVRFGVLPRRAGCWLYRLGS